MKAFNKSKRNGTEKHRYNFEARRKRVMDSIRKGTDKATFDDIEVVALQMPFIYLARLGHWFIASKNGKFDNMNPKDRLVRNWILPDGKLVEYYVPRREYNRWSRLEKYITSIEDEELNI